MPDGLSQAIVDFAALLIVGAVMVVLEVVGILFAIGIWFAWRALMRWCWGSLIVRVEHKALEKPRCDCAPVH